MFFKGYEKLTVAQKNAHLTKMYPASDKFIGVIGMKVFNYAYYEQLERDAILELKTKPKTGRTPKPRVKFNS